MIFDDYKKVKNQPAGKVQYALYYKFDNEPVMKNFYEDTYGFMVENWKSVSITASDFLWDLKNPLKYGLQNAFDQNPATSYVENTEDDLMKIEIWLDKTIDKLAIINGYAENHNLYNFNNSVHEIGIYAYTPIIIDGEKFVEETKKQNINCISNYLNWQLFEISQPCDFIKIEKYYKGSKYNDTCLAELNFYYENHYLFGDIND